MPVADNIAEDCGAVVVIVNDVDTFPPALIVAFAGLKLQLIPVGSPVQLKFKVPAIPDCELTFRVTADDVVPLVMLSVSTESESAMSGAFA